MIKKHKKLRKKWLFFFVTVIFFLFTGTSALADNELSTWYLKNQAILSQNNMGVSVIRKLAWVLVGALVKVCNAAQALYDKAFNFIDLTNVEKVKKFIETFKPILVSLMTLSLIYLGIILMFKHEKKPNLIINICIFFLCVTASSYIFGELNKMTKGIKDDLYSSETTEAYKIVDGHMVDFIYLDNKMENGLIDVDWSNKENRNEYYGSGIGDEKSFYLVNYSEVLNPDSNMYDYKDKTKDILGNHLVRYKVPEFAQGVLGEDSGYRTEENDNGWGWNSADDADAGNEFYYRYHFDFLPAIIELAALTIIFITMSYKVVRVAFELIVARLLAYLYSTELSGGEKIKKIFIFIRDSYILLVISSICIKVYIIISQWLNEQFTDPLISSIFSLFLAFSVIDGPNLVEKLLGMDAGLKSSTARMMAIGRMATGVAKGAARAASVKDNAQRINDIKSGKMSQGGLAGGIVGATFGKEVSNSDPGTHREGGILNKLKNAGSSGSDGSGGSEGSSASGESAGEGNSAGSGSASENGKGDKGDSGSNGKDGTNGKDGMDGKDGEKSMADVMNNADSNGSSSKSSSGTDFSSNLSGNGHSGSSGHDFMNQSRSTGSESSAVPSRSHETKSRYTSNNSKERK